MKIVVLLSRVPYPIEKGDKLRAFHQLRCLSKNHEIILCALSERNVHPDAVNILRNYCSEVHIIPIGPFSMVWNVVKALFRGLPLQVGYFYRCRAKTRIKKIIQDTQPDHIYCQLIRMAEYAKDSKIPKTLDYQDVFSMGVHRRAIASNILLRPFFNLEYKRLLAYENKMFELFDHKTIISAPDRDLIPHPKKMDIEIIPNGVDQGYFKPIDREKSHDIVFTGNMGYPPNVDAAEFLAKQIFPIVRKRLPEASLLIAGANPHPRVQALHSSHIRVTGWVEDIRECYAASKVFIAPMRIGTGLQNKLLEAMSMKLPCVTSPLANKALGAAENEEILVGKTETEYAEHLVRILEDPSYAETIASKGHDFVIRTFNWENSTQKLESLFQKTSRKFIKNQVQN